MGNTQPALETLWEKPGEQKSKESIQGLWEGQKRAVMGCRKIKATCESLVRDAEPMKQVDLMRGHAQATHELQDRHGDTGGQQLTMRAEPGQWEFPRAL